MYPLLKYFILLYFCCVSFSTQAQYVEEEKKQKEEKKLNYWSHSKEIGFNFTPLISSLVPFNLGEKNFGTIGIKTKFYGFQDAFRFSFGANINDIDNLNFLHIGLGYERRKPLVKKLSYTSGWSTLLEVTSTTTNESSTTTVGIMKFYGLEYNFNQTFFIGIESQLILGLNTGFLGGDANISLRPPVAIFGNVRLPRKQKNTFSESK